MKHAQSEFKETRFDWDSEPALERPSRLDAEFKSHRQANSQPAGRRLNGLSLMIIAAVSAGLGAISLLKPLLRLLSA